MAPQTSAELEEQRDTTQEADCQTSDVEDCRGDDYDSGPRRRYGSHSRSPSRERSRPVSFAEDDQSGNVNYRENRRTGIYGSQSNIFKADDFDRSFQPQPRSRSASFSGEGKEVKFEDFESANNHQNYDQFDSYDNNNRSRFERRGRDDYHGDRFNAYRPENMYDNPWRRQSNDRYDRRYRNYSVPRNPHFYEYNRQYDYNSPRDSYRYPDSYNFYDQGNSQYRRGRYGTEGYGAGYGGRSGPINTYDDFPGRGFESYRPSYDGNAYYHNRSLQGENANRFYNNHQGNWGQYSDFERDPYRSSLDCYSGFGYERNMPYQCGYDPYERDFNNFRRFGQDYGDRQGYKMFNPGYEGRPYGRGRDNYDNEYGRGYNQDYGQGYGQGYGQRYTQDDWQGYGQGYGSGFGQRYNQDYGPSYGQGYNQRYGQGYEQRNGYGKDYDRYYRGNCGGSSGYGWNRANGMNRYFPEREFDRMQDQFGPHPRYGRGIYGDYRRFGKY